MKPAHPFARDVYLTPSKVERFDIGLLPTVWKMQAGHSLRLVLSTQASAEQCQISLASGLPQAWPCLLTAPQQRTLPNGRYEIEYGGTTPSSLSLPIIDPARSRPRRAVSPRRAPGCRFPRLGQGRACSSDVVDDGHE